MSDEFSDYQLIERQALDKISALKYSKQSFLYIFWALTGGAIILGVVHKEDSPLLILAIVGIVFCVYSILRIDGTSSVIGIYQGLLRRARDENDLAGFRSSAASLNPLIEDNLRKVLFPFIGAL